MPDEQWIDRWWNHLTNHISSEVRAMHLHRKVWRDVREIVNRNGELPASYWWSYIDETYATSQVLALRRQADRHPESISLTRTLLEMNEHASEITLDFFLSRYGSDENRRATAAEQWRTDFGPGGGDTLEAAVPSTDLQTLTDSLAAARQLVNKHLAHRDAGSQPATLGSGAMDITFEQVHDAIDVVGALWRKYTGLMTGAFLDTLTPLLPADWTAVFRQPWLDDESRA